MLAASMAGTRSLYKTQVAGFSRGADQAPLLWGFAAAGDPAISLIRLQNFNQMNGANQKMGLYRNQYAGVSMALVGWYLLNLADVYIFRKARRYAGGQLPSLGWDWKTETNQAGRIENSYRVSLNLSF